MSDQLLNLVAPVEIQAAAREGKRPTASILAYSGGIVAVPGYGRVVIDLAGLSMPGSLPVLVDHRNELAGIIGSGTPRIEGGRQLVVDATLADTTESGRVVALAKSGFAWSASLGAEPIEAEPIGQGKTITANGRSITAPTGGFLYVTKSRLREASLTPVGADPGASVAIAASRSFSMGTENQNNAPANPPANDPMQAAWDAPNLTDVQRVEMRWNATRWHTEDGPRDRARDAMIQASQGRLPYGDFERVLLQEQLRDSELARIRAERPQGPAIHASRRDKAPTVIECAFAQKLGVRNLDRHFRGDVLDAASRAEYRDVALGELLIEAAAASGYRGKPRITAANLKEVLGYAMPPAPIQASHSTLSLPGILSNLANKVLLDGFNRVPQRWREVATVKSVSDFKTHTFYRLTTDLEYKQIGPTGEMEHGTPGEESYEGRARTYARMLGLTREDIINDDLGAFDDLRTRIGMGAGIALNRLFWTTWLAAANAGTFWTAARGNLVTDQLLDDDGLAAALKAFRLAQAPDGNLLDLEPDRLLTGPTLEAAARRFYSAVEIRNPAASKRDPVANIWINRFAPVIASQIENSAYTGYSDSTWWLAADPALLASAAVLFLDGRQEPVVESADADFNQLGIQFRGYHDFGVSMAEYRASVMVTAPAG